MAATEQMMPPSTTTGAQRSTITRGRLPLPASVASVALAALVPVALLAAASLWWPENGDQALFILTARQMQHGAVYYQDFWDIKQPGIYWFYQLGGLILTDGLGARVLEAVLAVVAGLLVLVIISGWELRRGVRLAAPTLVLGPYLVYAYIGGLGQIEGLMNVLLLTVIAASRPGVKRLRPGWAWFVAGLAIGTIPVFKTVYAPLGLLALLPAIILSRRISSRGTLGRCALALVGAVLPGAGALAYFAGHHALDLALRTTFQLPSQLAGVPHTSTDLLSPVRAAIAMFALAGPLAVIGLASGRRRGRRVLNLSLVAVLVAEIVLSAPQVTTPYRWLMTATPVGLLAIGGLEAVLGWLAPSVGVHAQNRRTRGTVRLTLAGVVAVVLLVPTLHVPVPLLSAPPDQRFGLSEADRIARGQNLPPEDTEPVAAAALVAGKVTPGSQIYVLGDPRIMALLHAVQGAEISGWTTELPASVWAELGRELQRSRPRFVYVDGRDWGADRTGDGRAVFDLLAQRYRVIATSPEGTWYETSHPGSPLPAPGGNHLFAQS